MVFVTYKQLRNNVIARRGSTATLEGQHESNMPHYAALVTAAYRWASQGYDWGQLRVTEEFAVAEGRAAIPSERNGKLSVYSSDPRPYKSTALPIGIRLVDEGGVWLDSMAETCWATYDPLPMRFTSTPWSVASAYVVGDEVYDDATGNCYVAKATVSSGTALTDTSKWALQRIWTVLEEPIILHCLANLASNQDEQSQYQTLIDKAELALELAYIRNTPRS